MMYPYYYGPGFGLLEFAWHLLGIIFAIWLIVFFVRMMRGGRHRGRWCRHMHWHAFPALEVLDERYAKGEISKEEYEERKKVLMGD